jgi:hypothetical protein
MPSRDVVADGVVHEVGHQSFDESGVTVERCGVQSGLDMQRESVGVKAGARQRCSTDAREVGPFPLLETALAAGQGEEAFDEVLVLVV